MNITDLLNKEKFQQIYDDHNERPEVACGYIQGQIDLAWSLDMIDYPQRMVLWSINDDLWDENKYSSPAYDE